MIPPVDACPYVAFEQQSLCLQAYLAEAMYQARADSFLAFLGGAGPAVTVVLVAVFAVALAKWRR